MLGKIFQVGFDTHIAYAVSWLVEKCQFDVSNHSYISVNELYLLWYICKRECR